MINLKYYNGDCFAAFKAVVETKDEETVGKQLGLLYDEVEKCYIQYNKHFVGNTLSSIGECKTLASNKKLLQSLYEYQHKVIRLIKKNIDEQQVVAIGNLCQNCTINSVNTMDHFLGQTKFPEYAVHPYNLFPSCSECNSYKGSTLMKNGYSKFLNLYLDKLPEIQYLFATIEKDKDGDVIWSFSIENRYHIDDNYFKIIDNHYRYLYLPVRMRLAATQGVGELVRQIKRSKRKMTLEEIKTEVIESARDNRAAYGFNHFKYILEEALVESPIFMAQF